MFNFILRTSIKHRFWVLGITLIVAIIGLASARHLVIDAVPDITNVQVQINTQASGYSPFEVERQITNPIELLLAGLPSLEYTRSLSRYGLSQVTVVFKDGTDIYFARQLIAQRLQESKNRLPAGIMPSMGPISTGLGEIYMFVVEEEPNALVHRTLQELREIQDWVVRPQLMTIPGVVEVNAIGGESKQIVVTPDLEKLRAYGLTLNDIAMALTRNNANVGAGFFEKNGEQFLVRVPAQVHYVRELNDLVVSVHEGTPVRIGQVATVAEGAELRGGAATQDGREVVLGTVFMLIGENGLAVSKRVTAKVEEIQRSLPEGVKIRTVYNRADLVEATIATVERNLTEGAILVVAVLFFALGNFRAALVTALVIPLAMLITMTGMVQSKLSANLMSLGALDFGLIVDGAVILVENCIKRLGEARHKLQRTLTTEERMDVVFKASSEVRQATMFGELIIMVVYIPILALSGIEGKMYHPMALTVLLALIGAFILSLTFVPAAVATFVTGDVTSKHESRTQRIQDWYRSLISRLLEVPRRVFAGAAIVLALSFAVFLRLGSEFIPSLDEGDITLHALRIPGTSLSQSIQMQYQLEDALRKEPEVHHVFAKIGTAEIATDPMPPSVADGYIVLKPRSEWPNPKLSKREIVERFEKIALQVPGNNYEFTQPIQMRFNELLAGVRSDVAVKIFGDDTEILLENGEKVESILSSIPGSSDVKVEQVTGLPIVEVKPNREKLARLGLSSQDVQDVVETAYAGREVSRFYQGDRNFPIVVRLGENVRNDIRELASLPIPIPADIAPHYHSMEYARTEFKPEGPTMSFIPLGTVADITVTQGPNQISRENGKRRIVVTANVRNRDLGSFVEEAQARIASSIQLPPGYWLGWGGQYENLLNAKNRLLFVVPVVLFSVFGLIVITFRSVTYSLLVFSGIPFALSGGAIALWIRDIPFSISAAVGFIALSGVAVLNGLVLVSFTRQLLMHGESPLTAIVEGAVTRLRPVLMTALVASLGFIPMAISHGTGSEVQRPLATVVIGGILSATALTLLVLPVVMATLARRGKLPLSTEAE
jgi:cobalt-zinc-cadmium resistance protein CzcA